MNDEVYITEPAYSFKMDNPVIFGSNKAFAGYEFSGDNNASKKLLALRILQDLTIAHIYDPQPAALVDLDIKRLAFAKKQCRKSEYRQSLFKCINSRRKLYRKDSSSTQISYLIATEHYSKAH
ncbi:MAG: hypothetical protein IPI65_16625 [Bacteroidetes bacterium]|nr:hypothetical protein [Bacteroidota bacterium]